MRTIIKTGILALTLALLTLSFTSTSSAEGHESSSIVWTGKKVTGEHTGTVDFKTFDWKFDEAGALTSANFTVDMTTIKCTDLDESGATKLEGHLSSGDFFNTSVYPTANFKTTEVKSEGKGNYTITGDMTIKDISKPLTFDAQVTNDGHMKHASALVEVNRTDFDIKYGSGSFFDGLGDKAINDVFTLAIAIKKH